MMNFKRTATIALVGGALIAWLAGAATTTRSPSPIAPVASGVVDQSADALASEIARLHERLHPSEPPRHPARNLFTYRGAVVAKPLNASAAAPHPAITEAPAAFAPPQPSLKLAGIGEDEGADGPIRIAFISGEGQLFMVKEGEMVTSRYRVAHISADVVELEDLATNTPRRLALR
jgi:hypothetical protein